MKAQVLITGGSGLIGGTILSGLQPEDYARADFHALLRKHEYVEKVKKMGIQTLLAGNEEEDKIVQEMVYRNITIAIHLTDSGRTDFAITIMKGLVEAARTHGEKPSSRYLIHTMGASSLCSATGWERADPIDDTKDDIHKIEKDFPVYDFRRVSHTTVREVADEFGIRGTFINVPIVYGEGNGTFGNRLSGQVPVLIRNALEHGYVPYREPGGSCSWSGVHTSDLADLYIMILRAILQGQAVPYGKYDGTLLVESGTVEWKVLSDTIARGLCARGLIDEPVGRAIHSEAEALRLVPEPGFTTRVWVSNCHFKATKARQMLGWTPKYPVAWLLSDEGMTAEINATLRGLNHPTL